MLSGEAVPGQTTAAFVSSTSQLSLKHLLPSTYLWLLPRLVVWSWWSVVVAAVSLSPVQTPASSATQSLQA